jgi:hypothetical protein
MRSATLAVLLSLAAGSAGAEAERAIVPAALWDAWPQKRVVPTAAPCLRHTELVERVQALRARWPQDVALEGIGRSVEGRGIHQLTVGRGPRKILLWSQMHGDEPSATPALLDLLDFLLANRSDPDAAAILERLTLIVVPMLNPDGAERYQRRNAQAIDINRDALNLATPEGRLLKAVRDRHQPELGFNLHDQNRRTSVGDTRVLASVALLAVSGDVSGTVTPGRLRAKRACTAIAAAVEPFFPGAVSRYDEDWSPRAFGDNITAWGTPVVLIESGGLAPGRPVTDLTRMNFVALLTTLAGLAADDLAAHDPAVYDRMTRNESDVYADVVLRGGSVWQPPAPEPYRADVAWNVARSDQEWAGCAAARPGSRVAEVGDARFFGAGESVDAAGAVVVPALSVSVEARARDWLTPDALDSLSALGVGTVRWHVPPADRAASEDVARAFQAPGRAALVVVPADEERLPVVPQAPPLPASGASLGAAIDALVGTGWRAGDRSAFLMRALAAGPASPLTLDARASLLLLRGPVPAALDPDALRLDRVFIDGREPAAFRP